MADGTENDQEASNDSASEVPKARADKPISFDFKLRLGSRESATELTGRATGELVHLEPIDWDSFTGLRDEAGDRAYKTDGDLPSIIVELANQIAGPDTLSQAAVKANSDAGSVASDEGARPLPTTAATATAPGSRFSPSFATGAKSPVTSSVAFVADDDDGPPSALLPPAVQPPVPPLAPRVVAPELQASEHEGDTGWPRIVQQAPDSPRYEFGEIARGAQPEPVVGSLDADGLTIERDDGSDEDAVNLAGTSSPIEVTPAAIVEPVVEPVVEPAVELVQTVQMVTGADAMALAARSAAVIPVVETKPTPSPGPMLSQLQLAPIQRRVDAERPSKPVDFHALLGQAGLQPAAVRKKKKRRPFRALLKLAVVLGLVGGGLYYGKRYVLDMRWDSATKPYAEAVADVRELRWSKTVNVISLPLSEYSAKLRSEVFGPDPDIGALQAEWRAVGLVEGTFDLDAAAISAAIRRPVFYSAFDGVIYELTDTVPDLRDFHLYVALNESLLDQQYGWSEGLESRDLSARTGVRALVAGAAERGAMQIVNPSTRDLEDFEDVVDQRLINEADLIGPVQGYPVDLMIGGGSATSPLFDSIETFVDMNLVVEVSVGNDGAVLDGMRALSSEAARTATKSNNAGMLYWYYALAGRMPTSDAWNAAVQWNGDATIFEDLTGGRCVTSTITPIDEAGRQAMFDAFTRWAAAGPLESQATAELIGSERIEIRTCDPGASADARGDGPVKFWGNAGGELAALAMFDLGDLRDQRSCVLTAIRGFGVLAVADAGDTTAADQSIADIHAACKDG